MAFEILTLEARPWFEALLLAGPESYVDLMIATLPTNVFEDDESFIEAAFGIIKTLEVFIVNKRYPNTLTPGYFAICICIVNSHMVSSGKEIIIEQTNGGSISTKLTDIIE